jgi:hypothetical protein
MGSKALPSIGPRPYDRAACRSLSRYPVKGLSAEPLEAIDLEAGAYFPGDRIYAIENGAALPRQYPDRTSARLK